MKTILITGANGFTGRHFVAIALKSGYRCLCLVRTLPKTTDTKNLHYIQGDLNHYEQLVISLRAHKFDYVVHLAAISFVGHGSAAGFYQTNLIGTLNLLDAIIETQTNIEKVLVASSGNIYGEAHQPPISEAMLPRPVNDYAGSKQSMEVAVGIRKNKLPIDIVRPFNYTGLGQQEHFIVPKIVNAFKSKVGHLSLGNTDVARDFSDVRDVCDAYVKLLEYSIAGETYNVCSGQPIRLLEIINQLEQLSGHKLVIHIEPKFVRENEIKILYGSDQKLRDTIGAYRQFNFKDTLRWMYQS